MLWIATGLLALIALGIAAWPARAQHRASAVVRVGVGRQSPATMRIDASRVSHAGGLAELVNAMNEYPRLDVDVVASADSGAAARKHVRDAADVVRATAAAVEQTVGERSQGRADELATRQVLDAERARLRGAQDALARWRAANGDADPAQQLQAVSAALGDAARSGRQSDVARLQQQQVQLTTAQTTYSKLNAAVTAAQSAVSGAAKAHQNAQYEVAATPTMAKASVAVGPVASQTLPAPSPFGRRAVSALLLIAVIIAADALFLTRTRMVSPYARETTRQRRARRRAERRARADERAATAAQRRELKRAEAEAKRRPQPKPQRKAKPKPRPKPRTRARTTGKPQPRRRVEAKPLDLPNIEVHLLDKEGGLRAVELRDTTHDPE